jgi:translation initiation factor IF-2
LRRFKDDVREVNAGLECGIGVEGFETFEEGDTIEAFHTEEQAGA